MEFSLQSCPTQTHVYSLETLCVVFQIKRIAGANVPLMQILISFPEFALWSLNEFVCYKPAPCLV